MALVRIKYPNSDLSILKIRNTNVYVSQKRLSFHFAAFVKKFIISVLFFKIKGQF